MIFVNLIPTIQGGTHVNGMRTGLLASMRSFCELHKLLPRGIKLAADDLWENCNYVLSIKVQEPQFSGQTKLSYVLGASIASFLFFFSLSYGAKLLAPVMKRPSSWQILDCLIGLIMFTIAVKLAYAGNWL